MRHSVENYIIFILLFSVNCIILYPKYFSYGEKQQKMEPETASEILCMCEITESFMV